MGYFDGLVDSSFKKDSSGRRIYYAWGIFGKGRVLEDARTEEKLRAFLKKYYIAVILAATGLVALSGLMYLLLLLIPLLSVWFVHTTRALLSQCPVSDEKLTIKDAYSAMAAVTNEFVIWLFLLCSLIFAAGGTWIMLHPVPLGARLAAAMGAMLFAAGAAALAYMLKLKKDQEEAEQKSRVRPGLGL
jgi:uncharacterized membrane protein HdeD (DUF308 family)